MSKNSLIKEQLQELVKLLSKRKNEVEGKIPIKVVMDILRELGLSDLLLENDIDDVCKQMDRESKMQKWKNYFNFALILIILTAPLFTFGGYKIREFIVAKFPELVGIPSNNGDFNIQVNNLQNELEKLEIENDKLKQINQKLNAKIKNSSPLVVPSPVISPIPTVGTNTLTQDPAKSVELKGIIYKFKNCQKSSNVNSFTQSISCAILLTSTKENVQLSLYSNLSASRRSRLLAQGKEYVATKVKFGTFTNNRGGIVKNHLSKDVPIEVTIDFDGVPLEVNQIDLMQFTSYLESSYYRGELNTELRNLPVIPEN
ncbi:MAG: hypothetical protein F6K26_47585 [Moorea sp. SIO2I5]|nr:hypothetical protein [Moorena sp. SIO2I5]